jgi:autotransporter-associated beta strand protein
MSLANTVLTNNGVFATGTLFVNGGTAICTNNIVKTGTLSVNTGIVAVAASGTLYVQGKIGSPTLPVDALNVTNATIRVKVDASGAITTNAVVATVNAAGTTTFDVAQAIGVSGPVTIPLVAYSTLNGTVAGNFTVTVPAGYIGSLVDNSAQSRIDLSISPSVIIVPLVWTGATNGDWDLFTTNWLLSGVLATYTDNSPVVFDDSTTSNAVNLTTALSSGSMVMSNSLSDYTFSGTGSLAGTNSLTLKGIRTTILDNGGSNSFTGGTRISAGTLQIGNNDANGNLPAGTPVVDNSAMVFKRTDAVTVDNSISGTGTLTQNGAGTITLSGANNYGATTIAAGSLQIGAGGTSGSLGNGNVTNSGSLIFNRSDNVNVANIISGSGSVTKLNNNVLTIGGNNSFGGGVTVNGGTVRLSVLNAPGTGTIAVNAGGTAVLAAAGSNAVVLAGGALSASASLNPLPADVTASPATASIIAYFDPANPGAADPFEMNITGTLHGSGAILLQSVVNDPTPDSGNGFRLRGTNVSDFSGVLVVSNRVKAELQSSSSPGPFSPMGTGKVIILAGVLTNNTVNGNFSELNLRNQSSGSTVIGNDVEVSGTGIAILDPLGTAPAGTTVTMGNLKIGSGQEMGVNVNSGNDHTVVFPTVTLNGGNATFSPKTSGWNTSPGASVGSDLSLGTISELVAGSGFTMTGLRTLNLIGNTGNSYSGSTTNVNGTLNLNKTSGDAIPGLLAIPGGLVSLGANNQIADASTVIVSGGTLALGAFTDTVGAISLLSGAITGSGGVLVGSSYDAQNGSVSAILGGTALLTKSSAGTVTLTANNIFSGATLIAQGTLALTGTGSISNSPSVTVAGGAILDVSSRGDFTFTLVGSQTLQGNGTIAGNLAELSGTTILPGNAGVVGALTVTGSVTLAGTSIMDLSKTPLTNDVLQAASIAYGGVLNLATVSGSPAPGDSFRLFVAGSYSGAFASVVPATPGTGLAWDTRSLVTNGTVTVVNQQAPTINTGGDITVGCAGAAGTSVLFAPTAADMFGNPLPVVCIPTSGTLFEVGRTPVQCSATDSFGNTTIVSFTVTVTDSTSVALGVGLQGSTIVLSWPVSCSQYILQQADEVMGPFSSVSPTTVTNSGGTLVATLPLGATSKYFRLVRGPIVNFTQLDLNLDDGSRPNSDWGMVDLTYAAKTNVQYFNLSINGSWQVQNCPVPAAPAAGMVHTFSFGFRLGDYGIAVTNVHYDFSLTPFLLAAMPAGSGLSNSLVATVTNRPIHIFDDEVPGSNSYAPAGPLVGVSNSVVNVTNFNNSASNTVARPGFPNQDCGTNECAPTAVSNGLNDLVNTHTNLHFGSNDVTIAKMKVACNWTNTGCSYGWWTNKAAYFGTNLTTTTSTNVVEAAAARAKGCAVEMRTPGHIVSVVCVIPLPDGKFAIVIVEDNNQGKPGGTAAEVLIYDANTNKFTGDAWWTGRDLDLFIIECPPE